MAKPDSTHAVLIRMMASGRVGATAASCQDLAAFGIGLPAVVPITNGLPPDAVLVCADADLSHVLAGTNHFGRCSSCDRPIMFRPHAAGAGTKLCIPCGLRHTAD